MKPHGVLVIGGMLLLALAVPLFAVPRIPDASLNLKLAAPIKTWDEAVPLGNGTMGVLFWGETNVLRLSLDRGELWDERPSKNFLRVRDKFNWAAMQEMVASNRMDEFHATYDANYDYDGPPTKLPADRVPQWNRSGVHMVSENFEIKLKAGQALEAKLEMPGSIPTAPANLAEPVIIKAKP